MGKILDEITLMQNDCEDLYGDILKENREVRRAYNDLTGAFETLVNALKKSGGVKDDRRA